MERFAHSSTTEDKVYSILYSNKQFKSSGNDEKNMEKYFSNYHIYLHNLPGAQISLRVLYIIKVVQRITEKKVVYAFQVRTFSGYVNGVKIKFKENEQNQ